ADMVMAVHEPGQQHLVAGADHRHGGMLAVQIVVGADGGDHAVLLQHRAVLDLVPRQAVFGAGDGGTAADQAGGHCGFSSRAEARASCSAKARSTSSRNRSVRRMRKPSAWGEKRLRGRASSMGTIVLMRPGRAVNTTTRSASATASSM